MADADTCSRCGKPLGLGTQQPLFGSVTLVCPGCQRHERAEMILRNLPHEGELAWSHLTEWERQFIPSVRQQFEAKGEVTEAQYVSPETVRGRSDAIYRSGSFRFPFFA